jgi:hypothetical protein
MIEAESKIPVGSRCPRCGASAGRQFVARLFDTASARHFEIYQCAQCQRRDRIEADVIVREVELP